MNGYAAATDVSVAQARSRSISLPTARPGIADGRYTITFHSLCGLPKVMRLRHFTLVSTTAFLFAADDKSCRFINSQY